MPRPPRLTRPLVTLHAAITLDGKLDDPATLQLQEGASTRALDAREAGLLLAVNYVHELRLSLRPRIDGRADAPTLTGLPAPEFFPRSLACRLLRMETRDGECFLHYRVVGRARARTSRH